MGGGRVRSEERCDLQDLYEVCTWQRNTEKWCSKRDPPHTHTCSETGLWYGTKKTHPGLRFLLQNCHSRLLPLHGGKGGPEERHLLLAVPMASLRQPGYQLNRKALAGNHWRGEILLPLAGTCGAKIRKRLVGWWGGGSGVTFGGGRERGSP